VFKEYLLALGLLQNHTLVNTTPDTDFKATRWYIHSMLWKTLHLTQILKLQGGISTVCSGKVTLVKLVHYLGVCRRGYEYYLRRVLMEK